MFWCISNVPDVVVVLQVSFTKYSLCIINQASHDLRIQLNIQTNPEHTYKISQVHVLRRRVFYPFYPISFLSSRWISSSLNADHAWYSSFRSKETKKSHSKSRYIWINITFSYQNDITNTWQKLMEELYYLYKTL